MPASYNGTLLDHLAEHMIYLLPIWLLHCLSLSSRRAILLSSLCASLLSHCLSMSSRVAPYSLPLITLAGCCVASRRAALLSSHCLVVPLSGCLVAPAGCHITSCQPLLLELT